MKKMRNSKMSSVNLQYYETVSRKDLNYEEKAYIR